MYRLQCAFMPCTLLAAAPSVIGAATELPSGATLTALAEPCQLGQDRTMRPVALLGTLAVAALAVVALAQAQRHPEQALGGDGAAALALQLVAGLGAYAAGLDLALRRSATRSGALLAASGIALLLGAAPLPDAGGALLFTAALALGTFAPLLAGAAAACHPVADRLGTAVVAAAAGAIAALGLLPAVVFDPGASGCF